MDNTSEKTNHINVQLPRCLGGLWMVCVEWMSHMISYVAAPVKDVLTEMDMCVYISHGIWLNSRAKLLFLIPKDRFLCLKMRIKYCFKLRLNDNENDYRNCPNRKYK